VDVITFMYLRRFLRFISAALSQSIAFTRDACQLPMCRYRVANRAECHIRGHSRRVISDLKGVQLLCWYSDKGSGWTVWSSNPSRGKRFISSPKRPYRLSCPTSLLFNEYRRLVPEVSWPRLGSWPLTSTWHQG